MQAAAAPLIGAAGTIGSTVLGSAMAKKQPGAPESKSGMPTAPVGQVQATPSAGGMNFQKPNFTPNRQSMALDMIRRGGGQAG